MSEKSDAVAAGLRKAILRGDYADGERLSQPKATRPARSSA
jgi:DNA-binding GntR family transcriptional regulator